MKTQIIGTDEYKYKIRRYCNRHFYTDCLPYEVIRVVSARKVVIRELDVELVKTPSYEIGGFLAHFENDEQEYLYMSNPKNPEIAITLTKRGWGSGNYVMSDKPIKFYDYNF